MSFSFRLYPGLKAWVVYPGLRAWVILIAFSFASCGTPKVCSGLNPEIGKYNTSKKVRKGRRSLHSGPEKVAYNRRSKQIKKRKPRPAKSGSGKQGLFNFHLGGSGGGSIGGGGGNDNNQRQQKN